MHKFFFNNETLPPAQNIRDFVEAFSKTLLAFNELIEKSDLKIERGIVTEKAPSEISLGDFNLLEVLDNIEDPPLKRLAYACFKNDYPIAQFFTIDREEEFLEKEYTFLVADQEMEALYLAYIAENKGFIFTAALNNDLKKDTLDVVAKDGTAVQVYNLYGEASNTEFIEQYIKKLNAEAFSLLEKLEEILGNHVFSSAFLKGFEKLTPPEQISIIDKFEQAKNRELSTPFYPDTKIIKDVSPSNADTKVYELRVYSPTALRVYFHEGTEKVFVASVDKKSNPDQNKDIKKALNIIIKLIKTDS